MRSHPRHASELLKVCTAEISPLMCDPEPRQGLFVHETPDLPTQRLLFATDHTPEPKKTGRSVAFLWIDDPEPRPILGLHFIFARTRGRWATCCPGCGNRVTTLYADPADRRLECPAPECRNLQTRDRQYFKCHTEYITQARADPYKFVVDRMEAIAMWQYVKAQPHQYVSLGNCQTFTTIVEALRAAIYLGPSRRLRYPVAPSRIGESRRS
jgi:hypothetical protein